MAKLLIVDDERSFLHSLQVELTRLGHRGYAFETGEQALHQIEEIMPDLALIDIRLPDMDGLNVIRQIKKDGHEFPMIVMTGFASISNAVAAMKEGAVDYIEKPVDLEQLHLVIKRNLENIQLKGRLELLERTSTQNGTRVEIIGQHPEFLKLLEMAKRVAAPDVKRSADLPTVLLLGETGTGKDLLAQFIHQNSPVANEPLVHLNCAAIPRELLESELFGYEKGAFTDAKNTKKGLLEIAGNGSIFLDEVGELPIDLQAKLLAALENRDFRRIGGTRPRALHARIIAATNADLLTKIKEGSFRDDLFFRLNVFTISLPPLRERDEDVELLARHFLAKFAHKYRKPVPAIHSDALQRLRAYPWPGNIRELSHVLENVTLLNDSTTIKAHQLGLSSAAAANPTKSPATGGLISSAFDLLDPACTLEQIERHIIEQVLNHTHGNVSEAAKILGLSRGALRRRLEHFDTVQ